MAIYMKFGSVNGSVTTKGFENWIELSSFQWGVGRAIGTAASGLSTREGSHPSIAEVTVTKVMDKSSPGLFTDAVAGDMDTTVNIKFTTTVKAGISSYLEYELTNTGLAGYSISSGGDTPTESLSLNFTKVSMKFTPLDAASKGTPTTVGYDLTKMTTT